MHTCPVFTNSYIFIQGKLQEGASIQRSSVVECMTWEQHRKLLAVGWRSGEISVSNLEESKDVVYEQSSVHRDAILFLCWNGSGSRLISGDQVWVWVLLQNVVNIVGVATRMGCW